MSCENNYENMVKMDGMDLQFVPKEKQTFEICLYAVMQNGHSLQFVHKQDEMICYMAIEQDPYAFIHVKKQTPQMVHMVLSKNSNLLSNVKHKTYSNCLYAIQNSPYVLRYVPYRFQSLKMCKLALKQDPRTIQHILHSNDTYKRILHLL